jgi:hypothetical protein
VRQPVAEATYPTATRMNLNELPYFPYPRDPITRFGFIVGDLIALGIVVLLLIAISPTLLRW